MAGAVIAAAVSLRKSSGMEHIMVKNRLFPAAEAPERFSSAVVHFPVYTVRIIPAVRNTGGAGTIGMKWRPFLRNCISRDVITGTL